MNGDRHMELWNEARALVSLAAHDNVDRVSRSVALALAYETLSQHPHPDVPYPEQIAIFKRKVDRLLDENKRIIESRRWNSDEKRDAHVFTDLEETEKPDYYPGR